MIHRPKFYITGAVSHETITIFNEAVDAIIPQPIGCMIIMRSGNDIEAREDAAKVEALMYEAEYLLANTNRRIVNVNLNRNPLEVRTDHPALHYPRAVS